MINNSKNALIGYSGFVGNNILSQHRFENLYDIKNIEDIKGKEFDLVVCAAAPGIKWLANKEPDNDYNAIKSLINNLKEVKSKNFVLISTIDVYPVVDKVNEDTQINKEKLLPYGKHRRILEEFIQSHFESTIIRLPGLFGKGLKGNIIYDFLNKKYRYIPKEGILQFYYLNNIWQDISIALKNNLNLLNISTEPIKISELSKIIFNVQTSKKWFVKKKPYYDMHSKYGHLWGKEGPYLYSKNEILSEIKKYITSYHSKSTFLEGFDNMKKINELPRPKHREFLSIKRIVPKKLHGFVRNTINNMNRIFDVILVPLTLLNCIWLRSCRKRSFHYSLNTKRILLKIGVFPIIDHYYEPMFNPKHLRKSLREDRYLPAIDFNIKEQLTLLNNFRFNDELLSFPRKKTDNELEFSYDYGAYPSGDSECLYSMIRIFKPRRIIEIGCGSSTLMALNAINRNKKDDYNYSCNYTCIEPYEQQWLEKTGLKVIRKKVEELPLDTFKSLYQNDILFIDSSHMIRPQGDVLYEILEILPSLNS